MLAQTLIDLDTLHGAALDYLQKVRQLSPNVWQVEGSQRSHYKIYRNCQNEHLSCDCMKYRMRRNRLARECPPLFKALKGDLFCHHTMAVEAFIDREIGSGRC